jgi:hypothetical protein
MAKDLDEYKSQVMVDTLVDITAPQNVEIKIRSDGKVVWINIDGVCRLRACQVPKIDIIDARPLMDSDEAGG